MENKSKKGKEKSLLHHLGETPRMLAHNHHLENLSEFLLHDICSEKGFDIFKAAYLVNNPDFDCMQGVSGYYNPETFSGNNKWENHKDFISHMRQSSFNKDVRSYKNGAFDPAKGIEQKSIEGLVENFKITDPMYHTFQLKHNNQGLFIFQKPENDLLLQDHLFDFLHMLAFCPIF